MILFGIGLILVAILDSQVPGALRLLLAAGGMVIGGIGFCLALGVNIRLKASADGGVEGSAEIPRGYTRKMTVSDSLIVGSAPAKTGNAPPKEGVMPPKEGVMPARTVESPSVEQPTDPAAEESARDLQQSSAEP